jgi:hypothetical protein
VRGCFPRLNDWLNQLPDPRCQAMCLYTSAHLWWHVLLLFLARAGSRNAFDQTRNTGATPRNLGELCGQAASDPRFAGQPTVTCSDNAARHARRVDPRQVEEIPLKMIRLLLQRRGFDDARLFDHWYVLIVDGTVREKCRQGFAADGKTGSGSARYRYVLQVLILGPDGKGFPFMHEAVDMHDPVADKEDCELNAFLRLSQRIKAEFPRLPICWVGDALYACQPVIVRCQEYHWKYILTLKEGRQPTTWQELLQLLPRSRGNAVRTHRGTGPLAGRLDCRWVEDVLLGDGNTNVILAGELTDETATLYAFITNVANLTPERVLTVTGVGRQRHRIEDHFNTEKNHGIGLEHVFCADPTAAKNYYTMMQAAQILWVLFAHGYCKRLYDWARRATDWALARAVGEGLRTSRIPPDLPPLGQIRFGFS